MVIYMNSVLAVVRKAGLVAVPAVAAFTIASVPSQAHAASGLVTTLPAATTLAQFSPSQDPGALREPDTDGPYKILLGVALALAVVSGVVYLRSEAE
jgi:hypothetical protein